jgi:hypothetical protein
VLSKEPSAFDVYVGDSSAIITGVNGSARFVDSQNIQYDVKPDADSLVADQNSVASSRRFLDSRWDNWNSQMDGEARRAEQNPSPYLPPQLQADSQVLADNGSWQQLNYNGETANYWTPETSRLTGRLLPWALDDLVRRAVMGPLRALRLGDPSSRRLDPLQRALVLAPAHPGAGASYLVSGARRLGQSGQVCRLGSTFRLRTLLRPRYWGPRTVIYDQGLSLETSWCTSMST